MTTIQPESVPGLVRLSIQGSMVQLLDLRSNYKLAQVRLGVGQTCIMRSHVETYYEGTLVPDRYFRAEDGEFGTERYFLK